MQTYIAYQIIKVVRTFTILQIFELDNDTNQIFRQEVSRFKRWGLHNKLTS